MKRTNLIRFFAAICVGLFVATGTPDAWAQDDKEDEETALESGPSVRRKLMFRSTRFEAAPMIGITAGDAYMRNPAAGLNLSYYLTNSIGLGVSGGYSPFHFETDLAKNVKASLDENAPSELDSLQFSFVQWFAGLEFKVVPLFGKFSLLNNTSLNYDIHLVGGLTVLQRVGCDASEVGSNCSQSALSDSSLTEISPAGTIGGGFRLFLGDAYALTLQIRDHLYRRAESTTSGSADPEFSSNVFMSLGFSLFFPQSVKISR